jgi:hypothetical protein
MEWKGVIGVPGVHVSTVIERPHHDVIKSNE